MQRRAQRILKRNRPQERESVAHLCACVSECVCGVRIRLCENNRGNSDSASDILYTYQKQTQRVLRTLYSTGTTRRVRVCT